MNNEEQVIDTIKRCKEFPTILELHNKYFNKLLGKEVPFTYKSFKMLMWDAVFYLTYNIKIISVNIFIQPYCRDSIGIKVSFIQEEQEKVNEFNVLNDEEFFWKTSIVDLIDKYE